MTPPFTRRRFLRVLAPAAAPALFRGGDAAEPAATPVRVLFVGNSYTYVNDLPNLFRDLVKGGGIYAPIVGQCVEGGFRLAQHADADKTVAMLNHGAPDRKPWDVVVLQEQSVLPSAAAVMEDALSEMKDSGQRMASLIWATNPQALIVLYQTWARHPELWAAGKAPAREMGADAPEMQRRIHRSIAEVARVVAERGRATNARVIVSPVGDFWQRSQQENPALRLHAADGSHPSLAGSMLAAWVLMASIGGRAAVEKSERQGGLSKADSASLRRLVLDHPELFSQAGQ